MKFYLSSFRIGNQSHKLVSLISAKGSHIGYIPNAIDSSRITTEAREKWSKKNLQDLQELGLTPELLDLKDYFGKSIELKKKIKTLNAVWVSGGNVFILRQAMKLSGLDDILRDMSSRDNFLYGGYSAAGCVLSPSLKAYQIVDDAMISVPVLDI